MCLLSVVRLSSGLEGTSVFVHRVRVCVICTCRSEALGLDSKVPCVDVLDNAPKNPAFKILLKKKQVHVISDICQNQRL